MPLHSVEIPGFKTLVTQLAPNLQLFGRTFFTQVLHEKFQYRKQQLIGELEKSTDASTSTHGLVEEGVTLVKLYTGMKKAACNAKMPVWPFVE